jgi:hypothetical protein
MPHPYLSRSAGVALTPPAASHLQRCRQPRPLQHLRHCAPLQAQPGAAPRTTQHPPAEGSQGSGLARLTREQGLHQGAQQL